MSSDTGHGFLLSRHWRDSPAGVELEFWFATDHGPLCAVVPDARSLFFLSQLELAQAHAAGVSLADAELRPLALCDFAGGAVTGLYFRQHREARRVADALRAAGLTPLEADINPAERYLMERFVTGAAELNGVRTSCSGYTRLDNVALRRADYRPRLRVVSLDIETAVDTQSLFSIAVYARGEAGEERRVFMRGAGADQSFVTTETDEAGLLRALLDWLASYDPDVIIGWNVVNFDLRYLQAVADRLGVPLGLGRGRRPGHWRELDEDGQRFSLQLPGRVVLDGIELLRAAFYRFESFALDHVANELLGRGKLLHGDDRGQEISRLFRDDKTALAAYNLSDCELVWAIFERTALLDFALARSAMTGLSLERMGGSVASFDNLYLPRLHRSGHVAPTASRESRGSPGGFVLDSAPGLYRHVLVFDFKSLYPSIIRTFCIDPLGLALAERGEVPAAATVPGFRGAQFAREGHILPGLIRELWVQRDAARAAGDAPLAQAIKIIMNSFYGVLGTPGCRFFDDRLASSITLRGHDILRRTRDRIEQAGHRVIYGDTDSVFVWIQDADGDVAATAAGRQLEGELNAWWRSEIQREFALDSALELVFETHFKRFVMPTVRGSDKGSKKRYAGLVAGSAGDELVFKGLEQVRTDWTRLARDFQQELYRRVFAEAPVADFVSQVYADVSTGRRDADLVYRKRLRRRLGDYERNVPPHVQAARLYVERGLSPPARGDWVEYVVTAAGAEPAAAALAPLDYQHYIERQLAPVADGILALVGTSFRALVDRQLELF